MTVDSSFLFALIHTSRVARPIARYLALVGASLSVIPTALAAQPPSQAIVLREITIVDVARGELSVPTNLLIEDGRIAVVAPNAKLAAPAAAVTIEGRGSFLLPGLWDAHVHFANREEATFTPERLAALYLRSGVIGVRDMGSDLDTIRRLESKIVAGQIPGPIIIDSGPFLDDAEEPYPAMRRVAAITDVEAVIAELTSKGVDFIKVQANLTAAVYSEIARVATARKISFAGHVPDAVTVPDTVVAGQRSIEHLSPALPSDAAILFSCSAREGELRAELAALASLDREAYRPRRDALQAALIDSYDPAKASKLFERLASRGTFVVPTLVWSSTMTPFRPELTDDTPLEWLPRATADLWLEGRQTYFDPASGASAERLALNQRMAAFALEVVGHMSAAGVALVAGTDSTDGFVLPGFSLHQELELFVAAGMSPAAALRAATSTAAELVGRRESHGSIEVGKAADLVLLARNPLVDIRNTRSIVGVIAAGVYHGRPGLDLLGASDTP